MKKNSGILLAGLFFLITILSGCEIIGDIFKAGMWTMLIIIALVIAIIFWIIRKVRK